MAKYDFIKKIEEINNNKTNKLEKLNKIIQVKSKSCKEAEELLQDAKQELLILTNKFKYLFSNIPDGVIIIDEKGEIKEINPAATEILGRSCANVREILIKKNGDKQRDFFQIMLKKQLFHNIQLSIETEYGIKPMLVTGIPTITENAVVDGAIIFLRQVENIPGIKNCFNGDGARFYFKDIVAKSKIMQEIIHIATIAAKTNSNILLEGESGTGKDLFAQTIHNHSERSKGPFLPINCGALPGELIGSELFGYEGGTFTGAKKEGNPGKFELASGGTIFLDEIAEMPLDQQVMLLRVLQNKSIIRLGGKQLIPVNVRIICASNKNLREEVLKGSFRKDLYYRLNVINIKIPSLREHPEDIPNLIAYFLEDNWDKWENKLEYIDLEVMDKFKEYNWPGNVRELQNIVERIIVMHTSSHLQAKDLPEEIYSYPKSLDTEFKYPQETTIDETRKMKKRLAAEEEIDKIVLLLKRFNGNVSQVAREMKVNRSTIYRKMKLYKLKN